MLKVDTTLERPVEVLQQGTDLICSAGSFGVSIPSGVHYTEGVTIREQILVINTGPNKGEYVVTVKAANALTLSTSMLANESPVPYKVIALQPDAVELPLVRLREVSLTGGAEGVTVPYRHPIDVETTALAGLNDDPLTDESPGLVEGSLFSDGTNPATFKVDPPPAGGFAALGVIPYDVLRLDGVAADVTYWYIVTVDSPSGTLILDRVVPATDAGNLSFTLGHPSLGTARVRFQDPTFFEVDGGTRLSFTAADTTTYTFRPSPAESSKMYETPNTVAHATATAPVLGQSTLDFTAINIFTHNVRVGDRVDVLSQVLRSDVHPGPGPLYEADVAGRTMAFTVDDVRRAVVFTGTGLVTLSAIAADINRQVPDVMRATVDTNVLQIWSRYHIRLIDQGSVGILDLLKFTNRDNRLSTVTFASFLIDQLTFNSTTGVSSVRLDGATETEPDGLFVDIVRAGVQRFYPGDMTAEETGTWSVDMKIMSFDPLDRVILDPGQQLRVSAYESFGYEMVVDNPNYSYSMGESVSIRCTPIVLGRSATDMLEPYVLPYSGVIITYDKAPQVSAIQDYMLLKSARVQCHNPLVRHFLPAYPIIELEYTGSVPAVVITDAISTFLETLYPNKPLEVYALLNSVSRTGVPYVELPQLAGFITHDENRVRYIARSLNVVQLGAKYHIMGQLDGLKVTKR